jgi:hypothetical protein
MRYQIETISLLDMPTVVIGRTKPSRGLWRRFRELQTTWDDSFDGYVESTTGIPRSLLDLIADPIDYGYESVEKELANWSAPIGVALGEYLLWDCYRHAGILCADTGGTGACRDLTRTRTTYPQIESSTGS